MAESTVRVVVVFPDLLGTYGDGGNATILARRLAWRSVPAEILVAPLGSPVPASGDLYLLGGGEDAPQSLAAAELRAAGSLSQAAERGAVVLAVCAGLQVVGTRFLTSGGIHDGVGLADVETVRGLPERAVGELVVEPDPALGVPLLTGYENHAGMTRLGPAARPLGRVRQGIGNGTAEGVDGFVQGRLVGTYLHGPALARNPALADVLLGWVVGTLPEADPELAEADREADELRAERLTATLGRRGRRRRPLGRFRRPEAPTGNGARRWR